jgi:hypothetical protein
MWERAAALDGALRGAPLVFYDLGQLTRCLISHTYRRFRHSFALQKSLKIVAKQIALGGNKLLRGSATHHVVHFLEIAVHALSAGRHHLRATAATATYRVLPIGASWDRPISSPGVPSVSCKRRSRAFAICIAKSVELMRDRQIEGLPCELVAPVRLLLEETRVLHSNPP